MTAAINAWPEIENASRLRLLESLERDLIVFAEHIDLDHQPLVASVRTAIVRARSASPDHWDRVVEESQLAA